MKNQFALLSNSDNGALLIIKDAHPDLPDYLANGFQKVATGTRRTIEDAIAEYWDENEVLPELQLVAEVK